MTDLSAFNQLVSKRYDTYPVLRRKYGIVKKIISYARAIVTVEDEELLDLQEQYKEKEEERQQAIENGETPEEDDSASRTRDLPLLNKTGETLKVGDGVWIHYWHDLANGYIAERIGLTKFRRSLYLDGMVILGEAQAEVYCHAQKMVTSESDDKRRWDQLYQQRLMNVDSKDNIEVTKGEMSHGINAFFINGFPAIMSLYCPIGNNVSSIERERMNARIKLFNMKLLFNEISVKAQLGTMTTTESFTNFYIDIAAVGTDRTCQLGIFYKYNNVEHIYMQNIYTCAMDDLASVFEHIGLVIICHGTIYNPNRDHPYGYIKGRIAFCYRDENKNINIGDFGNEMTLNFANTEEYEYAKCVFSESEYEEVEF